jgi:hypothetical protein
MVRHNRPRLSGTINLSGRDDEADREVATILAELPPSHPARIAFAEGQHTAALTHLLLDRADLIERLKNTIFACSARSYENYYGGFKRDP